MNKKEGRGFLAALFAGNKKAAGSGSGPHGFDFFLAYALSSGQTPSFGCRFATTNCSTCGFRSS
jgi:hypothetical protein